MALDRWILFLSMTAVVSFSPGPVMLLCLINGASLTPRHIALGMLGASCGNIVLMLLSALGVGALVYYWPQAFAVIGLAGALYLIYLAVRWWQSQARLQLAVAEAPPGSAFLRAFWVALSNPKGIVYFGALFPPFIQANKPVLPQLLVLTLSFLAIDLVFMTAYAWGGGFLSRWLADPRRLVQLNRTLAGVLGLAGVLLALAQLRDLGWLEY